MSVITISRGSFSGGMMLAERLASDLGYRCINRDAIVEKAAASHTSPDEMRAALNKAPGLWERLDNKRYVYLSLIKAALAEEVRAGRVVYHGHAGHLLLSGCPVLRVRVIAPLELRIPMARERLNLNREEAIAHIQKIDEDRRKWARYLYGIDWEDPSLYDVLINLEDIDLEEASAMIATIARRPRWSQLDDQQRAALNNFARASRISANIVTNPRTERLQLDVVCDGGAVRIAGKLTSAAQVAEVERAARGAPGVTSVEFEGDQAVTI